MRFGVKKSVYVAIFAAVAAGVSSVHAASTTVEYGSFNLASDSFSGFKYQGDVSITTTVLNPGTYSMHEYSSTANFAENPDPNVIVNSNGTDVYTDDAYGDEVFAANSTSFGPYLGPTAAQFTFTEAVTLSLGDITASFADEQLYNSTPDVYVYVKGVLTDLGTLVAPTGSPDVAGADRTGTAIEYAYNGSSMSFAKGETIDFIVGGGLATTKVDLNVGGTGSGRNTTNPVPLPTSAGVGLSMFAGLGLMAELRKRTKSGARFA